jgi:alginate O-acetyltransferase complex protein AlgJ
MNHFKSNSYPTTDSPAAGKVLLSILGITLFLGFLWLPMIDSLWPLLPSPPNTEKRALVPAPTLGWKTLGDFPKNFELFFNDHFGGRRWLVRMNHQIHVEWLGISPLKEVLVGRDGWLFLTSDKSLADHHGLIRYSAKELESIQQNIRKQTRWLKERKIPYIILVGPDKQSIYPEYWPNLSAENRALTRLDQILAYLGPEEKQNLIDVRRDLLEAKKNAWVYSRTDTHWNSYGAFIAYQKMMEVLSRSVPTVQPISFSEFYLFDRPAPGRGDLAGMLSLSGRLSDREVQMVLKHPLNPTHNKIPKALIFHDSFIDQLKPFLVPHFDRIIFLPRGKASINYQQIEREGPNFVLLELVERQSPALVRK